MKQKTSSANALIILCMLCDIVIRPFYAVIALNARTTIISALATSVISVIIVYIFIAFFNTKFENAADSKLLSLFYFIVFIVSSAASVVKAEQFYRYSSSVKASLAVFMLCVGLACVYAALVPILSLEKAAKAILILLIISFLLVFLSTQSNISFQNLHFELTQKENYNLWYSFNFAPEILLFLQLEKSEIRVKQYSFTRIIIFVFVIYFTLTLLCELVLGASFVAQTQPIYTLARLGNLSVFKRLDSLHTSIWLLCFTIKISAFFSASVNLMPKKIKLSIRILLSVILLMGSCFLLYGVSTSLQRLLLSALTIGALFFTVIISKAKRKIKYEKCI